MPEGKCVAFENVSITRWYLSLPTHPAVRNAASAVARLSKAVVTWVTVRPCALPMVCNRLLSF